MKTIYHLSTKMMMVIMATLFMTASPAVKAQTAYAIWCSSTATMYFTASTSTIKAGQSYDGATITNVWQGDIVTSSGN